MTTTRPIRVNESFFQELEIYKNNVKQKLGLKKLSNSQAFDLLIKQAKPENVVEKKKRMRTYLDFEPEMRF